jgi:hypothetical protein
LTIVQNKAETRGIVAGWLLLAAFMANAADAIASRQPRYATAATFPLQRKANGIDGTLRLS